MKKLIASAVEGALIAILIAVLFRVFNIEMEGWQLVIITVAVIAIAGFASWIRDLIESGGKLYNYEWRYQYGEHIILVKASNSEELYINGKLTDQREGMSNRVELKGLLDTGEKVAAVISAKSIKKQFTSDNPLNCELFIDGKLLQTAV